MISSFFRRLLGLLLSRAFWTIVGVVLVSLMIWFVGPILAFGEWRPLERQSARIWSIAALIALIALRYLIERWRKGATSANLADRIRQFMIPSRGNDDSELDELRKRFDEAMRVLRKARFTSGRNTLIARVFGRGRYLYELPWYIIIGAPGAGKTTALLNSGLSFPLARSHGKGAVRGVGGTRNCDWWFTDEAVLIDTAGRYTTQDSNKDADRFEWQGFVKLLRQTRASQPINGVLVTLSITELLDDEPATRLRHAEVLRQRLDELRSDLGIAFPVYVLVNKCDLLAGFDEYFAHLDRRGRQQVWGFTLPLEGGQIRPFEPQRVAAELALLRRRIDDGLVEVLQAESELGRRERIYAFPQQYGLLCEVLDEVVEAVFEDSRFSSSPFLRGVYFTSGTQEGAPLDRVLSSLLDLSDAKPPEASRRGTPRSYFLHELLAKVVFAESHLASHNKRVDRRARTFHLATYVLSVALLAGAAIAWMGSYRNNLSYLAEVEIRADRLANRLPGIPAVPDVNFHALLNLLTLAETVTDSVHFRVLDPLMPWTFGLYQGFKLRAGVLPLYEELLSTRLAPALKVRLERLLRTVAIDDLEFAFEILKAYLMLHDPQRFDAEEFKGFVLADWDHNLPSGAAPDERAALIRHLGALIDGGTVFSSSPPDQALIEATRTRLTQYSFPQRTYRRLVRSLEQSALPDVSIGSVVGPQAPAVFVRSSGRPLSDGVPSLYTYRGYHELFAGEVDNVLRYVGKDDSWVLGVSESANRERTRDIAGGQLALEIKKLYMWDYVGHWERFIDDIDIVRPRSLGEATELVKLLSSTDSPMARLMHAVVKETTLLKDVRSANRTDHSLLDRVRRTARATHDDVSRIVGPSMMPGRLGPEERPELIVDSRFEALRRAVGTGDGGPSAFVSPQSLQELHLLLSSVEAARAGGYPPPNSDLPRRLQAEAGRLPQPARRLLESVASTGATLVARETRVAKSSQMVGTVTRECKNLIEGRYPFVRHASEEVANDDFTRMFGPGGVLDSYFQTELAGFVDTSTSPWRLRAGAQGGLGGAASLAQFERASVIKNVFYRGGSGTPTVTIMLKPVVMDATITNFTLDVDGQVIRYQHGPQVGYAVRWPGSRGSNQIRVSVEPVMAEQAAGFVIEGPWALHRLFDRAVVGPGSSPERFQAVIDIGGRKATFEVIASSLKNPFRLSELQAFACPEGL